MAVMRPMKSANVAPMMSAFLCLFISVLPICLDDGVVFLKCTIEEHCWRPEAGICRQEQVIPMPTEICKSRGLRAGLLEAHFGSRVRQPGLKLSAESCSSSESGYSASMAWSDVC